MEIDHAGAQRVASADDGVGEEDLAAALQPIEQAADERIEVAFDGRLVDISAQIARHVAKRGDAQLLCDQLQLVGVLYSGMLLGRSADLAG